MTRVPYEDVSIKNKQRIEVNTKSTLIMNMKGLVKAIDILYISKNQDFVLPYSEDEYTSAKEFFEKHYGIERGFWTKLSNLTSYLQEKIDKINETK